MRIAVARKIIHDKKFWQYIDDVENDRGVYGELIKLSVQRFLSDQKKKDFLFDYQTGERVVTFIEKFCRHWKGEWANKPFCLEPHQHFYFINLYGWLRADGTRRFRSSYKEVARKNAKTTEAALDSIYHMCKDNESGAQVYAGATKEAQAGIVVNDAGQIIKRSPALKKRFKLFELRANITRIVYPSLSSFMAPIGRDSDTQDGFDPSKAVIDEYHAHPTSHTRDVIESGMGARRQPMSNIITTAGFNKQGPCYNLRHVMAQILRGILFDQSTLAIIHSMDKKDDWQDVKMWPKANPNFGSSVKLDYMMDQFTKAKNEGGQKEVEFKTKNLNQWTDAADVWVQDELWMKNHYKTKPEDLHGLICFEGVDLASTTDINAVIFYFPDFREVKGKKINAILPMFYIPADNVKDMSRRDHVDYQKWIDEGYVKTTPGNITDYDYIEADIIAMRERYQLKRLGYDPWNAGSMAGHLSNEGIECVEVRQGFSSLNGPTKKFERMARSGQFEHFNNPVIRWMLGNVALDKDANGNIKPNKAKSVNKIDGVSALICAMFAQQSMETDPEKSAGMYMIEDTFNS
jgi:phage terminase large subunit-like protein